MAHAIRAFSAALVLIASISTASAQTAAIRYVYDDLNRLTAVIDQQGNVARYVYDAVGNLLRIDRIDAPAGALAITLVSPGRGRVGGAVEIFGTGFGATPGENTVQFNGTAASVTEASPNRLLTTVPAGATTGSVTVTVNAATATSPTPFVVGGTIAVTPTTANVWVGGTVQFQATEDGAPATSVTWAVNGITDGDPTTGTITAAGLYTAPPKLPGVTTVTVTATHSEDRLSSASASVLVVPGASAIAALPVSLVFAEPKTDTEAAPAVSVTFPEPLGTSTMLAAEVSATLEPVVTAVLPASAARGASSVSMTLTGAGLSGATSLVFLAKSGSSFVADPGIIATDLVPAPDGTQLMATVAVATSALLGAHVVQIQASGGASTGLGTGGNGFSVTP